MISLLKLKMCEVNYVHPVKEYSWGQRVVRIITDETKFRKDMLKAKRKPIEEIWVGEHIKGVTDIARFAPSACNTQPWIVEHTKHKLYVYRYKKQGKRGIMPAEKVSFYNQIDMGIFLCFLELCLLHERVAYKAELKHDAGLDDEKTLFAVYQLQDTMEEH